MTEHRHRPTGGIGSEIQQAPTPAPEQIEQSNDFPISISDMTQFISMSKRFQDAEQTKEEYKEVDADYVSSLVSNDIVSIDKIIQFYKLDSLPVSEETISHIATHIYEQVNESVRQRFI